MFRPARDFCTRGIHKATASGSLRIRLTYTLSLKLRHGNTDAAQKNRAKLFATLSQYHLYKQMSPRNYRVQPSNT